jgi:CcmD family protein
LILDANWVVLGVALLAWGLLFSYLTRLDRRMKELEKR